MSRINNIIVDQRIVYIVDRNHNLGSAGIGTRIVLLGILNLGNQNTGQLLLQNIVAGHLQVLVNGQIDIIARNRVLLFGHLQNPAHAVHVHLLVALGSLKFCLHILLDT